MAKKEGSMNRKAFLTFCCTHQSKPLNLKAKRLMVYRQLQMSRAPAPDPATLLKEFKNTNAYSTEDDRICLFVGKNSQGEESAELLNQLQLDGQLLRLNEGVRPRRRGFHAIRLEREDGEYLKDLREVTAAYPRPLLVGPELRPLVFVLMKPAKKSKRDRERPDRDDDTTFANNSGHIYDSAREFPGSRFGKQ
jgi:hypothetical protein